MCSVSYICIKIHWIRWSSPLRPSVRSRYLYSATATDLDWPSAKAEPLLRSCQRAEQCEAPRGQRLVITKFSVALLPLPAWHADKEFRVRAPGKPEATGGLWRAWSLRDTRRQWAFFPLEAASFQNYLWIIYVPNSSLKFSSTDIVVMVPMKRMGIPCVFFVTSSNKNWNVTSNIQWVTWIPLNCQRISSLH